jgi:antitoxin (DNA-binding transcriptional repressor) of toxin-antitoxin stability system
MERMTVAEASRDLKALVHRVCELGITVDLEQDHEPVVRITPIRAKRPVMASDLNELFASLPSLGDDAEAFARDVEEGRRSFLPEKDPWE